VFDRIVVPLDGSHAAEVALNVAAQIPGRRLQLFGVEPDCTDLSAFCTGAQDREAYLETVASPLRDQGRSVATMVALGDPAQQISTMAGTSDLIVMSSHGRGSMGRLLFGSVADTVMRHASAPTLIVRGEQWQATPLRRIVVPLDGSSLAEQALSLAVDLAGVMKIPVHLVRVVDFDQVEASVLAGLAAAEACARQQAELAREARASLALLTRQYQSPDCVVTSDVRIGDPVEELLAVIKADDLTVLATHARGGIARWFVGSVAEELVHRSAGPTLLMRADIGAPPAGSGGFSGRAGRAL
jgi:nucleotide-binding universal stress UspA family protein